MFIRAKLAYQKVVVLFFFGIMSSELVSRETDQ